MRWIGKGLRHLVREPLVHFLAAGAALFGIFNLAGPAQSQPQDHTIAVDRQALLTYMQYRANAFQPEYFSAQLDAMSATEKKQLVDDYIREETLYREAQELGLGEGDYVIRRRLAQKMEFLIEDLASARAVPVQSELAAYFEKHRDRYAVEPSWTFTHVFFDTSIRGAREARASAEKTLRVLNARRASFDEAPRYGDRFAYLQNYVERTSEYVESQFGSEFLSQLGSMQAVHETWIGPIPSRYGYHLVLLTDHTERRLPELGEVKARVAEDFLAERLDQARKHAIDELSRRYTKVTDRAGGRS